MPRDYLSCLSFTDMKAFIQKLVGQKLKASVVIKLKNVKKSASMQSFDFDVVAILKENGKYVPAQGLAYFTNFGCTMEISYGKNKIVGCYDNEWTDHVYNTLKEKETLGLGDSSSQFYNAERQDHIDQVKAERNRRKQIKAEEENFVK